MASLAPSLVLRIPRAALARHDAVARLSAVVDVSSPPARTDRRRVLVVELKRGDPLRVAAPTAVQLRNAPAAIRELASAGVVADDCDVQALIGDSEAVLEYLA